MQVEIKFKPAEFFSEIFIKFLKLYMIYIYFKYFLLIGANILTHYGIIYI